MTFLMGQAHEPFQEREELSGTQRRSENRAAIVSYFESGIKERGEALGIELERILVRHITDENGDDSLVPVPYSGDLGVAWLLDRLRSWYPDASYDAEGDLLGVARPGESVTIEPAAQVELSAGPFIDLRAAQHCFEQFQRLLESILAPHGIEALTVGYNPIAAARDLGLIPKERYTYMDRWFQRISDFGMTMMRGSASTQVSIDYTSEDDCLRKMRVAFALTPLFALICDNSAIFEGAPREHELVRTEIWEFCDPARCGVVPGILDASFTWEDYADHILDTPAILIPNETGRAHYEERTFGEVFAHTVMTRADVEHAVSMFFNDVRLKTYIEIRPADSMPVPYVIAYAALIRGLFYDEANLVRLEERYASVTEEDLAEAKHSLMAHGYAGEVYGRPADEEAQRLIDLAEASLSAEDRALLAPLADLVRSRRTFVTRDQR